MVRRVARVDDNQAEIVKALEEAGALVTSLAAIGGGVADLLVLTPAKDLRLLEIKNPKRPPSRRRLTPFQVEWHKVWPVTVVTTVEGALEAIQG